MTANERVGRRGGRGWSKKLANRFVDMRESFFAAQIWRPPRPLLSQTRTDFVQRPAADMDYCTSKKVIRKNHFNISGIEQQLNQECWIPPRREFIEPKSSRRKLVEEAYPTPKWIYEAKVLYSRQLQYITMLRQTAPPPQQQPPQQQKQQQLTQL